MKYVLLFGLGLESVLVLMVAMILLSTLFCLVFLCALEEERKRKETPSTKDTGYRQRNEFDQFFSVGYAVVVVVVVDMDSNSLHHRSSIHFQQWQWRTL